MCLLQYPEMFSDRLCLTVRTWMTKNLKSKNKNADLLNDAQTYNASNEPLLNDAQTYNHSNEQLLNVAQTSKRKENSKKKSKKEYPLFKLNDLKYINCFLK